MHIIKSKHGLGLPVVLAIVTFVLGTTATFLSYIYFQSNLSDIQIEESETYANAVADVRGALYLIARDQSLDPAYLLEIEELMQVNIETYGENLYTISSLLLVDSKPVQSYLTGSVSIIDTFDTIFQYTGEETAFELSPLITPSNLAASFLPQYIEENFSWITPETTFTDFQSVVSYIRDLALDGDGFSYFLPSALETQTNPTVTGHWYIDGSVNIPKNKNLTVPDGKLLIIDGNLTMNQSSTINGNFIVNGNVTINGKGNSTQNLLGTYYINGNLVTANKTYLSQDPTRPTFVFAEGDILLGNNNNGYGYFLSDNFTAQQGNIYLTGGVYTVYSSNVQNDITENTDFTSENLYDYAIPETIAVEAESTEQGETGFIFTTPKLS